MYLKIMLFFLSAVALTAGQYDGDSMEQLPANILPRRICGDKINMLLNIACNGVFKKSGPPIISLEHFGVNRPEDNGLGKWFGHSESEDFTNTMPWLGRHNVKLALAAHRRLKKATGIYDECCLETCTWAKLRRYCGSPEDYNIDI